MLQPTNCVGDKTYKKPYVAYDNDSPAYGAWQLGLYSDN